MIRNFGSVQKIKGQPQGILLGLGTGGNSTPADVYVGKTFTNDNGEQIGTNPYKSGKGLSPLLDTSILSNSTIGINPIPIQVVLANTTTSYTNELVPIPTTNQYICIKYNSSNYFHKFDKNGGNITAASVPDFNATNYAKAFFVGGYLYIANYGRLIKFDVEAMTYTANMDTVLPINYAQYDEHTGTFYLMINTGLVVYGTNLVKQDTLYDNSDGIITGFAVDNTHYYISTTNSTTSTYKIKKYKKSDKSLVYSTTIAKQVRLRAVLSDGSTIGIESTETKIYKLSALNGSIVSNTSQPFAGAIIDIEVINDHIYSCNGGLALYKPDLSLAQNIGSFDGTCYGLNKVGDVLHFTISSSISSVYRVMLRVFYANIVLN